MDAYCALTHNEDDEDGFDDDFGDDGDSGDFYDDDEIGRVSSDFARAHTS